ncbi:FecR domain-containing protein [Pedobacter sp. KR3-3]|uniref:FecR domain-containing protein n=1 Tax=Pedobacter albus TaxID=3113905 RepID=A0ABU7I3Z8_9SPHI|nr:FecR domain-containing protein [Pedobacter sp. KR3-3]MEE1944193.1 FecR domain-containing protein [Pedobacter sp. KR3-3]
MERTNSRLQELIELYLQQSITEADKIELWGYVDDPVFEAEIKNSLSEAFYQVAPVELTALQQEQALNHIFQADNPVITSQEPQRQPKLKRLWTRIGVAATIAVVLGLGLYLYQQKTELSLADQVARSGIKTGGNKAFLTLANNKRIVLSESQSGIKLQDNKLSYSNGTSLSGINSADVGQEYTLSTPKGGTYQLVLPDGSKVWLNASSSIRFPAVFNGNRSVELSGEGYFEVAKDEKHSFVVNSRSQSVEVLGTHFNIQNYQNETTAKTTLLEGKVKVSLADNGLTRVLKPGEQAGVTGKQLKVYHVDIEDVVAWKEGYFNFNNETIAQIMAQLAMWYDVKIDFVDPPSEETFTGQISRTKSLAEVLDIIAKAKPVKFKIKGRTIEVSH